MRAVMGQLANISDPDSCTDVLKASSAALRQLGMREREEERIQSNAPLHLVPPVPGSVAMAIAGPSGRDALASGRLNAPEPMGTPDGALKAPPLYMPRVSSKPKSKGTSMGKPRASYDIAFKRHVVNIALQKPPTSRIKPTCTLFPGVEPCQLRMWIAKFAAPGTHDKHKRGRSAGGVTSTAAASLHAPRKQQRVSHAGAKRSSVPGRATTRTHRVSTSVNRDTENGKRGHEDEEEEEEEETEEDVGPEASGDGGDHSCSAGRRRGAGARRCSARTQELALAQGQAALRQAEVEQGLPLEPSDNVAGFKGVNFKRGRSKPYQAQVRRGGKEVYLGSFATAEEAALCYVRDIAVNGLGAAAAARAAAPAPLTAEEALRQAEAEGLTLQPNVNKTGFKGVRSDSRGRSKPYDARVWRSGRRVNLGSFATAEEAALCCARDIADNGAPALAAEAAAEPAAVGVHTDGSGSPLEATPVAAPAPEIPAPFTAAAGVRASSFAPLAGEEWPTHEAESVGVSVQGMPTVPADSLAERPRLVADLCKIIERQSSQIADLRRAIASASAASVQRVTI